jgi:hypothetical protein
MFRELTQARIQAGDSTRHAHVLVLTLLLLLVSVSLQAQTSNQNTIRSPDEGQRIQTEIIRVWRNRASPSTITRAPGRFFLEVVNLTGDSQADVSLRSASSGARVPSVLNSQRFRNQRRSVRIADLASGTYELTYVPTGSVICKITIQ